MLDLRRDLVAGGEVEHRRRSSPLAEIASAFGFADQRHSARLFSQVVGGEKIVQTSRRLMKPLDRDAAPFMGN
jgi:hypothetical protein